MGIEALGSSDDGRRVASQTEDDWPHWRSAAVIRSSVLNDLLLD